MFHTHGVRNWRGKQQHRMNKWRESEVEKKLHLTDKGRNDLARFAGRYFQEMFVPRVGSLPAWARDDIEHEGGPNDLQNVAQDTVGCTKSVPPVTAATATASSVTSDRPPDAPEARSELASKVTMLDKMKTYLYLRLSDFQTFFTCECLNS